MVSEGEQTGLSVASSAGDRSGGKSPQKTRQTQRLSLDGNLQNS